MRSDYISSGPNGIATSLAANVRKKKKRESERDKDKQSDRRAKHQSRSVGPPFFRDEGCSHRTFLYRFLYCSVLEKRGLVKYQRVSRERILSRIIGLFWHRRDGHTPGGQCDVSIVYRGINKRKKR